jgi:hypothetical protein
VDSDDEPITDAVEECIRISFRAKVEIKKMLLILS